MAISVQEILDYRKKEKFLFSQSFFSQLDNIYYTTQNRDLKCAITDFFRITSQLFDEKNPVDILILDNGDPPKKMDGRTSQKTGASAFNKILFNNNCIRVNGDNINKYRTNRFLTSFVSNDYNIGVGRKYTPGEINLQWKRKYYEILWFDITKEKKYSWRKILKYCEISSDFLIIYDPYIHTSNDSNLKDIIEIFTSKNRGIKILLICIRLNRGEWQDRSANEWEQILRKRYENVAGNFTPVVIEKKDTNVEHDRFLLTQYHDIEIGVGFNLLDNNGNPRHNTKITAYSVFNGIDIRNAYFSVLERLCKIIIKTQK